MSLVTPGKSYLMKWLIASKSYHTIILPSSGSYNSVLYSTMIQLDVHFSRQNEPIVIIVDLSRSDNRLSKSESRQFWSMLESLNEGCCSCSFQGRFRQFLHDSRLIRILVLTNLSRLELQGDLSSDRYVIIGKNNTTY